MGLFNILRKKETTAPTLDGLFSFGWSKEAPKLTEGDYLRAYLGWVFACVNAIAQQVATMRVHLYKTTAKGREEVTDHPAIKLLYKINPQMTSSDLKVNTQSFLELSGNSFWYLVYNLSGYPIEIWPLDPTRITVVKDEKTFVAGYVYLNDAGKQVPLTPKEVIWFRNFNPKNQYRGMGTMEAAALAYDTDRYSGEWNRNFFYNSAQPSAVLEMDGTLTPEKFAIVKNRWDQQYKGVDNAHKTAILENGLKYKQTNLSQKDMDFLEQRRFSRDEIMAIFRVPKAILGLTEDVNRANAEATEYIFGKWVIKPKMQFIVDRLNEFFLPLFKLDPTVYSFDFDDPVPQNEELEIKRKQAGLQSGWYAPNEVRAEEGLLPVDGGDEIYIPLNLMPIGTTATQVTGKSIKKKDITSEADKELEVFINKRNSFIRSEVLRVRKDYKKILNEQRQFFAKNFKKAAKGITKDNAGTNLELLFANFDDQFKPLLESINNEVDSAALAAGGQDSLDQLKVGTTFDLKNPRAMEWLKQHALAAADSILGSVKEEIKKRILDGVNNGLGAQEIADNIAEFFDVQEDWRALRIARTEVISGYARGSLEGYKQSGLVHKKRWLTAQDDRVEEECAKNEDDGSIEMDALFSSGDDAPPVHPNCRCVLQPVVGDE